MKSLSDVGARSQLAQEVALGRMVMLHTFDVGTPVERHALLARVDALPQGSASKVFARFDVGGVPIVVTHFLPNFTTLPAWLDAQGVPAGIAPPVDDAANAATMIMAAPVLPKTAASPAAKSPVPEVRVTGTQAQPGGFTAIFGAQGGAPAPPAPPPVVAAPAPKPRSDPGSFTNIFGAAQTNAPTPAAPATPVAAATPVAPATPVKPATPVAPRAPVVPPPASFSTPAPVPPQAPAVPPTPVAPPTPAPPPTPARGESFTSVFGQLATPPASPHAITPPASPFATGPLGAPSPYDTVIPPVEPLPAVQAPTPAPPPARSSGEFTKLFERLDGNTPAPAPPIVPPPVTPAKPTFTPPPLPTPPMAAPPKLSVPPVPAVPSMPPAPSLPPTPSWQAPPAPNLGAMAPSLPSAPRTPPFAQPPIPQAIPQAQRPAGYGQPAAGPSEFTRVLGRVQQPPVAGGFVAAPVPLPTPPAPTAEKSKKSYLPLIIAANVLLVVIVGVIVLLVLARK